MPISRRTRRYGTVGKSGGRTPIFTSTLRAGRRFAPGQDGADHTPATRLRFGHR